MAGDDWTVVGNRGRPRKPRQQPGTRLSDRTGGSPAAGTRAARRSAEADADDCAAEEQQDQGVEPPEPLPGWGIGHGHATGVKGRAGRAKRRQAWVERSPAERVRKATMCTTSPAAAFICMHPGWICAFTHAHEHGGIPAQVDSLKRSVLEAKKDVQASGFFAALMAALQATDVDDGSGEQPAAGGDSSTPDGSGACVNKLTVPRDSAADPRSPPQQQQQQLEQLAEDGSHGSGGSSSMAVDQAPGSSPMATDGAGSLSMNQGDCMLRVQHEQQAASCASKRLVLELLQVHRCEMQQQTHSSRPGLRQRIMPPAAAPPATPLLPSHTWLKLLAAQPRPTDGGAGQTCRSWWFTASGPSSQVGSPPAFATASRNDVCHVVCVGGAAAACCVY